MREYHELTAKEKTDLVHTSIMFMRSITKIYGSEKGMEVWNTIASTIGDDLKGDIFFGIMTGKYSLHHVTIVKMHSTYNFIPFIKAVRLATGWGLKEAKDFCDEVRNGKPQEIDVTGEKRETLLSSLRELGIEAN